MFSIRRPQETICKSGMFWEGGIWGHLWDGEPRSSNRFSQCEVSNDRSRISCSRCRLCSLEPVSVGVSYDSGLRPHDVECS